METLGPWLALAGLGALHGASPANGWMFAAACVVRAGDPAQARRALLPIALGHAVAVALVVAAVTQGLLLDRAPVQRLAGVLLVVVALQRCLRGRGPCRAAVASEAGASASGPRPPFAPMPSNRAPRGPAPTHSLRRTHAGLALWSGLMTAAHGAGLMLVPALAPLCLAYQPAREITASGSVFMALAALAVHLAAMLATTGMIAAGVCRALAGLPRRPNGAALHRAWTFALAVAGTLLATAR